MVAFLLPLLWPAAEAAAVEALTAAAAAATAYGLFKGGQAVYNEAKKADEEAEKKAGSVADVCSDCPPPRDPECDKLYEKMNDLVQELAKRRGDMLADKLGMYELFLQNPDATVPDPRLRTYKRASVTSGV